MPISVLASSVPGCKPFSAKTCASGASTKPELLRFNELGNEEMAAAPFVKRPRDALRTKAISIRFDNRGRAARRDHRGELLVVAAKCCDIDRQISRRPDPGDAGTCMFCR